MQVLICVANIRRSEKDLSVGNYLSYAMVEWLTWQGYVTFLEAKETLLTMITQLGRCHQYVA
jgi:hypothetical protein